ncbi:MAG TPA: methylmalonyl Co-A mutase-associated GTPase MeaB [Acidimicrobiales bacterium]|nr:methylmalonyl Co-A mutase-associated GTPase MeaB [Acidimicrobiales bacterium]
MRSRDPKELIDAAVAGDRASLARLLSVVERGGQDARTVGQLAYPRGGAAYTVGITGAPGAGKSTLTDRLIGVARRSGDPVAVLAVDPSSPFTGGAILGDRVRMQEHALDTGVFIRSMATRGHLGGLALAAREAIRVLDAAGFPLVLVETVGVGQVEVDIAEAADTTVVVVNPGWGDSVQANKAGLLEIADLFVINKADRPGARETERDLSSMLDMSPPSDWRPPIVQASASDDKGIDDVFEAIAEHRRHLSDTGQLVVRRAHRLRDELRQIVIRKLEQEAWARCSGPDFDRLVEEIAERRTDPYTAAEELIPV